MKKTRMFAIGVLIVLAVSIAGGGAAVAEKGEQTLDKIVISKAPDHPIIASITDNQLMLESVPDEPIYNYFHIQIYPADFSEEATYIILPRTLVGDYQLFCPLPQLSDGDYFFTVRTASTEALYWNFSHWINVIGSRVPFFVTDEKACFRAFPVYLDNLDKISKYRYDPEALDYYRQPSADVESESAVILELAEQITTGADTNYDKARLVHNWIVENIWYDLDDAAKYPNIPKETALSVLHNKRGVCQGFSNLTAAMLRSLNIPCKVVIGELSGSATSKVLWYPHAWNEFYADGRWINLDVTADTINYYENGEFGEQHTVYESYFTFDTFFDPPLYSFSLNHKIEKSTEPPPLKPVFATPTASKMTAYGKMIPFDAFNINSNNYFKLRDIAYMLKTVNSEKQFEIKWDNDTKVIDIVTYESYTPEGGELQTKSYPGPQTALISSAQLFLDGKSLSLYAYTINGNNYFKLRDIAAAIDFDVDWDGETNTVMIEPDSVYTSD
jgi:transglutaminase-like putative cysteine protease